METRTIFVSLVMADLTAEIFRVRGTLGMYIALDLQHGTKHGAWEKYIQFCLLQLSTADPVHAIWRKCVMLPFPPPSSFLPPTHTHTVQAEGGQKRACD